MHCIMDVVVRLCSCLNCIICFEHQMRKYHDIARVHLPREVVAFIVERFLLPFKVIRLHFVEYVELQVCDTVKACIYHLLRKAIQTCIKAHSVLLFGIQVR
jgi:hypothetical protein